MFLMNGSWYFATREGDQGPFFNEQQAQAEISRFISAKTELAKFQKNREAKHAQTLAKMTQKLELVMPDERTRLRPPPRVWAKNKVYI